MWTNTYNIRWQGYGKASSKSTLYASTTLTYNLTLPFSVGRSWGCRENAARASHPPLQGVHSWIWPCWSVFLHFLNPFKSFSYRISLMCLIFFYLSWLNIYIFLFRFHMGWRCPRQVVHSLDQEGTVVPWNIGGWLVAHIPLEGTTDPEHFVL